MGWVNLEERFINVSILGIEMSKNGQKQFLASYHYFFCKKFLNIKASKQHKFFLKIHNLINILNALTWFSNLEAFLSQEPTKPPDLSQDKKLPAEPGYWGFYPVSADIYWDCWNFLSYSAEIVWATLLRLSELFCWDSLS